jgi:hypothetical protein
MAAPMMAPTYGTSYGAPMVGNMFGTQALGTTGFGTYGTGMGGFGGYGGF